MTRSPSVERKRQRPVGGYLRVALAGLTLLSLLGLIPNSAWALTYVISPGATFDSAADPPAPLAGTFELATWGVCATPCEPDAYGMSNVVLTAGGETLSSGVVEPIAGGPIFGSPAFESLPNGSVLTGEFPIQRSITSEGVLTDAPHNHDYFENFSALLFAPLGFIGADPREVIFSTPRGEWPVEVTLAYAVIERTGTTLSGYDGSGSIYANELVDVQNTAIGQVLFTAHPVPEPSTGLLVLMGLIGLSRRHIAS